MSRLSCGVLVLDAAEQLLVGHASGTARRDIPKGLAEPGEQPVEAALRELAEETGFRLDAAQLCELGQVSYLPGKRLHLFSSLSLTVST